MTLQEIISSLPLISTDVSLLIDLVTQEYGDNIVSLAVTKKFRDKMSCGIDMT